LRHFISYIIPATLIVAIHLSFNNNPFWQLILVGLSCGLVVAANANVTRTIQNSAARIVIGLALFLTFYVLDSLYLIASVFTANGFTDQAMAHLNLQSLESGGNKEVLPYHYAIAAIAVVLIAAWFVNRKLVLNSNASNSLGPSKSPGINNRKPGFLLLAMLAFMVHPGATDLGGHWWRSVKQGRVDATLLDTLERSHVSQKLINNTIEQRKGMPQRSIVLIYMESFERAYLNHDVYPGLAPNLAALEAKENTYGSFQPSFFASHTIAGLVSSLCGVPYAATGGGNGNSMNRGGGDYYMPHVQCLSDISNDLGYYNAFYQGGALTFTRKGAFFKAHGFHEVKGWAELWKDVPRRKRSTWGLHDDVMFGFAKERIDQLAQNAKQQPFLFTLLTLDTHDPFGKNKQSNSCQQLGVASYKGHKDHHIQDQIHCSDKLISNFVKNLRDEYSDTIDIYLVADHLAHAHSQGGKLKNTEQRDLIFIGINDEEQHKGDRNFTHLDIGPTILDRATGGFLKRMGLGVSLLSTEETLLEKFGAEIFNAKIRDNSAALAKRYWNYPSIEDSPFVFDQNTNEFQFAGTSFPSPVLFKLDNNNTILSYHSAKIDQYLKASNDVGRVISVQKCQDFSKYQKHPHPPTSYCLMVGDLGAKLLHIEPIESGREYSLSTFSKYLELESDNSQLRSRLFETPSGSASIINSDSSKQITPILEVQFATGTSSTSRMVTNYWNLSLFEKFGGFKNHKAAQQDGLYFFSISAGAVTLITTWNSCDQLKSDDIKSLMQNANTTEFVLMSGRNGMECKDYRSGTPFDKQISTLKRGESLIAYLNLEKNSYKHMSNANGENIQLNLIDDKIYSSYLGSP